MSNIDPVKAKERDRREAASRKSDLGLINLVRRALRLRPIHKNGRRPGDRRRTEGSR